MIGHIKSALAVKKATGKGIASQLQEIVRLRMAPMKLGAYEYYFYRVFDDEGLDPQGKQEFVGWRMEKAIDRQLNEDSWRAVANDKLLCYTTFKGLGIPYPPVKAVYHQQNRFCGDIPVIADAAGAGEFLRNRSNYPFFVKPVHGTYGRGTFAADDWDEADDTIVCGDGKRLKVEEVIRQLAEPWAEGYLFQTLLRPHPRIEALCGPSASSVRIVVLLTDAGPQVFRAIWKIPVGGNPCDNFSHGQSGNLLGWVDPETGQANTIIKDVALNLTTVSHHPDTNENLVGVTLPDWEQAKQIALQGATAFPGLKLQHWDVALTDQGPQVLEINVEGSFDLHQLAGKRGFYDARLRQVLEGGPTASPVQSRQHPSSDLRLNDA